ncbi:MAG TPA: ABC transporter permease [Terracidiphilus sp.]|jgi:putative ABC transport system permease protein
MNKLIFANLLHRPLRSVISILAVAIEVVMILSVVAIFNGMLNDQKDRTNGIGADLILWPSNSSYMNGVGGAPLPVKDAEALRRLPHISVVSPVIQHLVTTGRIEIIWGIDYASFEALKPFVFLAGGAFQGPNDVIVDNNFAGAKNSATGRPYAVGDTIMVMGHPFRISGIVVHGKGGGKLIPIDTMGQLVGAEDHASNFYIKCDEPGNTNAVIAEIHATKGLENFPVQTIEDWLETMTPDKLPGFNIAVNVITVIAVIIGFLVIFQSMYTAVLERTREIGILKSMGASKMTIVGVVLRECAVLAVAGVLVGIACVFGVQWIYLHLFPSQHFEITGEWLVRGGLIAFSGALFGALYPAWMASRKDPIDALAYE